MTRRLPAAAFFLFFGLYLVSGSRERPWGDAHPVWEVADNLVSKGTVAVSTRWPYNAPPGRNGKFYALNPLITSLVHVPGAAVYRAVTSIWPGTAALALPIASHLGPAALGGLTCLLFFALARRFVSARAAGLATVMVGAATGVWVYARYPYTEIVQTACFTGFALALAQALDAPDARAARRLGLWTGLLVNAKLVYLVCIPGAAAVVIWLLRREGRRLATFLLWAAAVAAPLFALIPFYNWLRWGQALHTGYTLRGVTGPLWVGLWGLLLSPGKSVFLYSPPLIAALFGIPAFVRRQRALAVGLGAALAPVLIVYGRFLFWHGDYAWGPRYLTFALPVLTLPAAFAIESALGRRLRMLALRGVLAAGVAVQLIGNAFYWDHWIRIAKEASARWLGKPDRSGATPPDRGGICDACFEDLYAEEWLPPFQPMLGHLWLLKHVPFGDSYAVAEKDAPWHMYTRITVKIDEQWYRRARLDWWLLDWGNQKAGAAAMALLLCSPMLLGVALWRRPSGRDMPCQS